MIVRPWKKLGSSNTLAEGFGKSFVKQRFVDHRGAEVDFFFFEQPDWSVVLPITKSGTVLLVRQWKQGAEKILQELPGGTANFSGESPEVVIRRELQEETGYTIGTIQPLGFGYMNSRNSHTRVHYFLATECVRGTAAHPDAEEDLELFELPLTEWIADVRSGNVEWDSIVVTLRSLPYLDRSLIGDAIA